MGTRASHRTLYTAHMVVGARSHSNEAARARQLAAIRALAVDERIMLALDTWLEMRSLQATLSPSTKPVARPTPVREAS
jgi:hypothetical protein